MLKADKTVALRTVTRGQATVDKVQLLTGVEAGEQVITEGADRLKDGAKVVLPTDKPAGNRRKQGAAASASASASASAPAGGQRRAAPGAAE